MHRGDGRPAGGDHVRERQVGHQAGDRERQLRDDGAPVDDQAKGITDATLSDLRKWRALAIKAVKAKKPIRDFVSDAIPFDLHARVQHFVRLAAGSGDISRVVAAFDLALADYRVSKAGEDRQLTKLEERAAKAYKRVMRNHFREEGAALVEHLKKGLS